MAVKQRMAAAAALGMVAVAALALGPMTGSWGAIGTAWAGDDTPVIGEPHPWSISLQPAASPVKHLLDSFNHLLMPIIIAIVILVLALLIVVMVRFNAKANPVPSRTSHNTVVEVLWTVVPVLILVTIAIPSFKLLYYMDRTQNADMTIKVTGHQWYWEYTYPDQQNLDFNSMIIADSDLKPGQRRLLDVDNRLVVPVDTTIRLEFTGADVIHSWFVPALGVQLHAVPGRLNETWTRIDKEGVYYGQCTLICGINHGFMPIAVEAVSKERFAQWLDDAKKKFAHDDGPAASPARVQVALQPQTP